MRWPGGAAPQTSKTPSRSGRCSVGEPHASTPPHRYYLDRHFKLHTSNFKLRARPVRGFADMLQQLIARRPPSPSDPPPRSPNQALSPTPQPLLMGLPLLPACCWQPPDRRRRWTTSRPAASCAAASTARRPVSRKRRQRQLERARRGLLPRRRSRRTRRCREGHVHSAQHHGALHRAARRPGRPARTQTSWTEQRDVAEGVSFAGIPISTARALWCPNTSLMSSLELNNATLCAISGTTSEENGRDFFKRHRMSTEIPLEPRGQRYPDAYLEAGRRSQGTNRSSTLSGRLLDEPETQ